MNIHLDYRVEIRKEGFDKTLVLIDKLTETEANKVFLSRLPFPPGIEGMKSFYFPGYGSEEEPSLKA